MANTFIILLIIGFVLYKIFKSDSKSKKRRSQARYQNNLTEPYSVRSTGRNSPRKPPKETNRTNSSFIQSAKRQEAIKNWDEAADLYLRGGQVYSAAKMKALKGPTAAAEAINVIRVNSPNQSEMITRNLVNEFYYRLEQPATAAALLRNAGFIDEAIAVEVAAGISSQAPVVEKRSSEPAYTPSASLETAAPIDESLQTVAQTEPIETTPVIEDTIEKETSTPYVGEIKNTLLMASMTLDNRCSVCKKEINSGDSFLQCLNCGMPGHYRHIAEMIKVTGKCPSCKQRLVMNMFDI